MIINLGHYLIVSALLLAIGAGGMVVHRRNLIALLMCLELVLLASTLNILTFALHWGDLRGHVLALVVLAVAAAETAVALAILVAWFRLRGTIATDTMTELKG
ncbi:MAG: NADH-quinone oxidoreductase subunit NuoK [Alphaproteobacteria bacterium]|nr:MAG: NADH-quinone oxidoreductase subunit NuoK [Alphaproteobacteria bacterium]